MIQPHERALTAVQETPIPEAPEPFDAFTAAKQKIGQISAELRRGVVMSPEDRLAFIGGLSTGSHVLLDAPYGTAKTTAVKTLAKITDGTFARIQGTPDIKPSDIIGQRVFNLETRKYEFVRGPIFSNNVLADELQRTLEKSQAGLVQAMEEGEVTPPGSTETLALPTPHFVAATRNPDGEIIDNGILDRFAFGITLPKLTAAARSRIKALKDQRLQIQTKANANDIANIREVVSGVDIEDEAEKLANDLVDGMSSSELVNHSDSVEGGYRAFEDILDLARVAAVHTGHSMVDKRHVALAAPYGLAHRTVLSRAAQRDKMTTSDVVTNLLEQMGVRSLGLADIQPPPPENKQQ